MTGKRVQSVDVELVTFGIFDSDRVVVDPLLIQDADRRGAQIGQPSRLGVDSLPAGCDRNGLPAAGVDVQVKPVLYRLAFGRLDDAVCADTQVYIGDPDIAPIIIPGAEANWRRCGQVGILRGSSTTIWVPEIT
jgi:hypothetical protein